MELLKSTLKLLQLIRYIIVHSCITLTAIISWTKTNVIAEALVQGTYEVKETTGFTITNTEQSKNTSTPKTGDNTNIYPHVGMMFVDVIASGYIFSKRLII